MATFLLVGLTSCFLGPERWEPQVVSADYAQDGRTLSLDLNRTGPTIMVDAGDQLELLNFTLRLLPTRRTSDGTTITRVADIPDVPQSALNMTAQVSATIRKRDGSGHCYDRKDQLITDWVPVEGRPWIVPTHEQPWTIGEDWDEIRIDIHARGLLGADPEAEYVVDSIMLQPSQTTKRLGRNMDLNIFNRILDSFRGDRDC